MIASQKTSMEKSVAESVELAKTVNKFSNSIFDKNRKITAIMDHLPLGIFTFNKQFLIEEEHSNELRKIFDQDELKERVFFLPSSIRYSAVVTKRASFSRP